MHELWTCSSQRHRMNLKPETPVRHDSGIILDEMANISIAIDLDHTYSIGPCRIRNQAKRYCSPLSQEVVPVRCVLLHDLSLGFGHVLSKGWTGRNQFAEKGRHIGTPYPISKRSLTGRAEVGAPSARRLHARVRQHATL
jgi:hypothetical protein